MANTRPDHENIPGLEDANLWDSRQRGAQEEFVKRADPKHSKSVDDSLGLEPITIRLQKELVRELKTIAAEKGLAYQPLVRQILTTYVAAHKARATELEYEGIVGATIDALSHSHVYVGKPLKWENVKHSLPRLAAMQGPYSFSTHLSPSSDIVLKTKSSLCDAILLTYIMSGQAPTALVEIAKCYGVNAVTSRTTNRLSPKEHP